MKNFRLISIGTLLSVLLISAGDITDNLTFDDWDLNEDSLISRSEFVSKFTDMYVKDWNVTDDEYLDDEDVYKVTYKIWDVNDDNLLSKKEWVIGYDHYYGDYILDGYETIDTNGDGFIDYKEYYTVLHPTDFYAVWDVDEDTFLNEYELARLVFNNWDMDNDNFIELSEYKDFDSYYLDI